MFKSKCCDADAVVSITPDFLGNNPKKMKIGTCSFSCSECGKPCDIRPIEEVFEEMKNKEVVEDNEILTDWKLTITRSDNGYELRGVSDFGRETYFIQDDEEDELKSHESLLQEVMEYFVFGGSKHSKERLQIIRKKQR